MIRVNLLPGGKKRQARSSRSFAFKMPSFGGAGALSDGWLLAGILVPLLALGAAAWMYMSVTSEEEELLVALDEAVQDSVRWSDVIERTELLQARSDSIAEKVGIIQEIDEGRYIWPHIMDEVARALPDYTWLSGITPVSAGEAPGIQIGGQAGSNFAITLFMEQLEASPFLRDVQLISSEQTVDQQTSQQVYSFRLETQYVQPPLEFLETVPLFTGAGGAPAADTSATEGAGTPTADPSAPAASPAGER